MQASIAAGIARTGTIVAGLGEEMVNTIDASRFARFALGPTGPVDSNHPAFVIGHLALYPNRMAQVLGMNGLDVEPPASWEALFAPGVPCRDDADGSVYPGKDELVSFYARSHRDFVAAFRDITDDRLREPTPAERYRERFPTLASFASFILIGHAMMHIGQVSAWRRFEGLGSLR
ncbi:MAG: DinB family protein [Phycisphaerales bacterium]